MNDEERINFLEAVIKTQNSIIERYAALVAQVAQSQKPPVVRKVSQ